MLRHSSTLPLHGGAPLFPLQSSCHSSLNQTCMSLLQTAETHSFRFRLHTKKRRRGYEIRKKVDRSEGGLDGDGERNQKEEARARGNGVHLKNQVAFLTRRVRGSGGFSRNCTCPLSSHMVWRKTGEREGGGKMLKHLLYSN